MSLCRSYANANPSLAPPPSCWVSVSDHQQNVSLSGLAGVGFGFLSEGFTPHHANAPEQRGGGLFGAPSDLDLDV